MAKDTNRSPNNPHQPFPGRPISQLIEHGSNHLAVGLLFNLNFLNFTSLKRILQRPPMPTVSISCRQLTRISSLKNIDELPVTGSLTKLILPCDF